MPHSGRVPYRQPEKVNVVQREAGIRQVSESIDAVERKCGEEGFDSAVVEDVGGMLTLGVCSRCGINLEVERLGVSLLDDDRNGIEFDMASRIRSRSGYLERAAEEVLGPVLKDSSKNNSLAYWTVIARRLESKKLGSVERNWLGVEGGRQDEALMSGVGLGFKTALTKDARRTALSLFSRIRRAGNRVPLLSGLFRFS